jgi:hypothetical protein
MIHEEGLGEIPWDKKDYAELAVLTMRLPDDIMAYEKKILALNRGILAANDRQAGIEHQVMMEVFKEKETFTNQTLRDSELAKRLREHIEYQAYQEEKSSKTLMIQESKAEIDRLKNQFRGLEIFVELMKLKYRIG